MLYLETQRERYEMSEGTGIAHTIVQAFKIGAVSMTAGLPVAIGSIRELDEQCMHGQQVTQFMSTVCVCVWLKHIFIGDHIPCGTVVM